MPSLICKDIPSDVVVAGIPAKVIGSFDKYRMKLVKDSRI